MKKSEKSLYELQNTEKQRNICIMVVPEDEREGEGEANAYLKK